MTILPFVALIVGLEAFGPKGPGEERATDPMVWFAAHGVAPISGLQRAHQSHERNPENGAYTFTLSAQTIRSVAEVRSHYLSRYPDSKIEGDCLATGLKSSDRSLRIRIGREDTTFIRFDVTPDP